MNMKQIQKMMQQAQTMQKQLESEMEEMTVEATSGGGMVAVRMDGKKNLISLEIDPEAVDPEDVDMLQDMIVAAINEATKQVDEQLNTKMGGLTGDLLGGS